MALRARSTKRARPQTSPSAKHFALDASAGRVNGRDELRDARGAYLCGVGGSCAYSRGQPEEYKLRPGPRSSARSRTGSHLGLARFSSADEDAIRRRRLFALQAARGGKDDEARPATEGLAL
ncbi:Mannan polymerase complex subunit mnn9 [Phytophthora nicotianae]|uniref:Mannan polymerase complex subunit mnn9 n=1 Tax=Phytophthora nicotianae TaxID=4792 RepID=A0A0W8CLA9_PHYNI|nr:Mannan polymerase complex subunit mnn9 [Phytophthora nicotianae]